jgi:hypothetical protein
LESNQDKAPAKLLDSFLKSINLAGALINS